MKRTLAIICVLELALAAFAAYAPRPAESITPEFHALIRAGNVASMQQALARGLSPNARDEAGNTVLMQAATCGDLACIQLLVQEGADVNAASKAGATPLIRAAHDYDKASFLIAHGANVNVRSALGNTPLMLAARPANSHKTVEFLLAHGATVNATNNWGATALMSAVAGGDEASIRALLKAGANPNAQLAPEQAAFIFAGGRTPLMWAAFRGDLKAIKLLVNAGADINLPGILGTPLTQATWANQTAAAKFLIEHGANVNAAGQPDGYTPLHWAASTEDKSAVLTKLLLANGADANRGGGEKIDAFMDVPQTPLMLARRRGETPVVRALLKAGATNETPDKVRAIQPARPLAIANPESVRSAVAAALPLLQETSVKSKEYFVNHISKQDCVSCHQQFLPMAAVGGARKAGIAVDAEAEKQLAAMVQAGELKNLEVDWEALFHPDAAQTKGYALLGEAAANIPPGDNTDAWVHHLSVIQAADGHWHNNLPRPPIQTSDIGATALAINALQKYPLPGRKAQFAKQVERAKTWLWSVKPQNTDSRVYQLLGLAWAGENVEKLQPLARALAAEQRTDGGWAQLPALKSDAFATGQAVYALKVGAALPDANPAVARGKDWLVRNQLEDGSWYVHRRAFPFQPTMQSGFPHGKDSWISAAATSWAVMALTAPDPQNVVALAK